MKPIIELLIQDIEDENTDIEKLSETDFKRVFETYNSLYKRCINLKEEDFDSAEKYQRFMHHVKTVNNNDFITLNFLEEGIDNASSQNFKEIRDTLNLFCAFLKAPF